MTRQPTTRKERLKRLVKMRIDYLKKMGEARHGRAPRPGAPSRSDRPTRTV